MNTYFLPTPPQLLHDDAIYWVGGAYHAEYHVARFVLEQDRDWALAYVHGALQHMARKTVPKEWQWYTAVASEIKGETGVIIYCHTLYEQPAYREIKLWRTPPSVATLRLVPDNAPFEVKDLPLHRLMYYGQRVRGALDDGVLHIVW